MKQKLHSMFTVLALLAGINPAAAQGMQFFRISGPASAHIIAFRPNGTLVWSNATTGATYTVQTATSLSGGGNWVDYVQIPVTNHVNTNQIVDFNPPAGMALIPAGTFTMGDTLDGESDAIPTNVTVSAFYMDVDLVSSNQWAGVYFYATGHGYTFTNAGAGIAANHPVQTVDWYDCVKWCNARSQQAGLTPAYCTDAGLTQVYTNGETTNIFANWSASGYRLPTEAEWEKAARGGLSGQRFPLGNTISESQANYYSFPNPPYTNGYTFDLGPYFGYNTNFIADPYAYTSPVGFFEPNGYGLYDMAGNVFEWCWDWYGTPYGQPSATNPTGPGTGSTRVLRGGCWGNYAIYLRCAGRAIGNPAGGTGAFGFRCVRGP